MDDIRGFFSSKVFILLGKQKTTETMPTNVHDDPGDAAFRLPGGSPWWWATRLSPQGCRGQCLSHGSCQMSVHETEWGRERELRHLLRLGIPASQSKSLFSPRRKETESDSFTVPCCASCRGDSPALFFDWISILFCVETPSETKEELNTSAWRWRQATCPCSSVYIRKAYLLLFSHETLTTARRFWGASTNSTNGK